MIYSYYFRTLIERARVECQNHWFVYNERMTVESCAQAVSNLAIQFGDSDDDSGTAMSRPFGVAVMFAGLSQREIKSIDKELIIFAHECKNELISLRAKLTIS